MPIRDNTSLEKVLSKCPQNLKSSSHEMRTTGFPLEGSKDFPHFGSPLPKDFRPKCWKSRPLRRVLDIIQALCQSLKSTGVHFPDIGKFKRMKSSGHQIYVGSWLFMGRRSQVGPMVHKNIYRFSIKMFLGSWPESTECKEEQHVSDVSELMQLV